VVTLILGMVRDLYDLVVVISQELRSREAKVSQLQKLNGHVDGGNAPSNNIYRHTRRGSGSGILTKQQVVVRCLSENKPVILDLVKNCADLVLPLEAMGHIHASPGVQGLAGIVSSVIGIVTTWQPLLRLVPS
jgi:hypothetical protein